MRIRSVGIVVVILVAVPVAIVVLGGHGGANHVRPAITVPPTTVPPTTATTEAPTVGGLRAAAQEVLSADATGQWGSFWDHWDPASQALISRDEYLRRKSACPGAIGATITVVSIRPGASGGIWTVRGRRGGSVITYQFRYDTGRWAYVVTDSTVKAELKEPYAAYVARPGCTGK